MNQAPNLDEKLLRRRKSMVTGMVVLTALVLLGFIFGSWQFLKRMGNYLEEELGTRLLSIATLTADLIEAGEFPFEYVLQTERLPVAVEELNEALRNVDLKNQLQGVYLVDERMTVIAHSRELFERGDRLTFLEEDSAAFAQAETGVPEVASMKVIHGNRFKSAFAPVLGPFGEVIGVVAVQANADFFQLIRMFQRGLILGGVVSGALVLLLSAFLYWAVSLLIKTHESLRRNERLAAMGQMAATVAHEIRNPLSIIKGTADVLQSKYGSKDTADELFGFIPNEVRRLNRLVNDFLTFARDRDLEYNSVDLADTVTQTLSRLRDEMQAANVELQTEFEQIPEVRHDDEAINQVLLNFTINAIQAMKDGGRLTVRLNSLNRRGRRYVCVEVKDTGPGFQESPEKIFEPFYTTKTSGSGLGLAICRRIIEKHDGWIEAESKKEVGTTMRFYLPTK